jgi:hypothetical protein
MNEILTVAIIIAITAFFKKQLGLSGWRVLLAAFIVALFLGLEPVIVSTFPVIAPWLSAVVNVIVLFLTAAGSVDFITAVRTKDIPPDPGLM